MTLYTTKAYDGPSREGQALVLLFVREKRPLLASIVAAGSSWVLSIAAEILNMYYAPYTCSLCNTLIAASSLPNYARTRRGYICYACKFCDFCQKRATIKLNGANCCDECRDKMCIKYSNVAPPVNALTPSTYEHDDRGITRIFFDNKCHTLSDSTILMSECDHTPRFVSEDDEACRTCRDVAYRHCLRHNSVCRAPGCKLRVDHLNCTFLLCQNHFNDIGFLLLEILGLCPTDNNAALKILAGARILHNKALTEPARTALFNVMNKI